MRLDAGGREGEGWGLLVVRKGDETWAIPTKPVRRESGSTAAGRVERDEAPDGPAPDLRPEAHEQESRDEDQREGSTTISLL